MAEKAIRPTNKLMARPFSNVMTIPAVPGFIHNINSAAATRNAAKLALFTDSFITSRHINNVIIGKNDKTKYNISASPAPLLLTRLYHIFFCRKNTVYICWSYLFGMIQQKRLML